MNEKSGRSAKCVDDQKSEFEQNQIDNCETGNLRIDAVADHINDEELRGIEFRSSPTHCTWFGRKKKLFSGTKDF